MAVVLGAPGRCCRSRLSSEEQPQLPAQTGEQPAACRYRRRVARRSIPWCRPCTPPFAVFKGCPYKNLIASEPRITFFAGEAVFDGRSVDGRRGVQSEVIVGEGANEIIPRATGFAAPPPSRPGLEEGGEFCNQKSEIENQKCVAGGSPTLSFTKKIRIRGCPR